MFIKIRSNNFFLKEKKKRENLITLSTTNNLLIQSRGEPNWIITVQKKTSSSRLEEDEYILFDFLKKITFWSLTCSFYLVHILSKERI